MGTGTENGPHLKRTVEENLSYCQNLCFHLLLQEMDFRPKLKRKKNIPVQKKVKTESLHTQQEYTQLWGSESAQKGGPLCSLPCFPKSSKNAREIQITIF